VKRRQLVDRSEGRPKQFVQARERQIGLNSTPRADNNCIEAAFEAAYSSRAVLPIPGSPRMIRRELLPASPREDLIDHLQLALSTEQHA